MKMNKQKNGDESEKNLQNSTDSWVLVYQSILSLVLISSPLHRRLISALSIRYIGMKMAKPHG